jgi:hypothetical protein
MVFLTTDNAGRDVSKTQWAKHAASRQQPHFPTCPEEDLMLGKRRKKAMGELP